MDVDLLIQGGLLIGETIGIGVLLLSFFRLRSRFGLAPLYVTLGSFQHVQTSLAGNLAIQVAPGLLINPGSTIMFSAVLFMTLVVYIREDLGETRSLVYGIVLANLTIGAIIGVLSLHIASPLAVINPMFDPALLTTGLRVFLVGTFVLVLDVALLIVIFELACRLIASSYLRVFLTLALVLLFDSVVFMAVALYPADNLGQMIVSSAFGKLIAAAIFPLLLAGYLRHFDRLEHDSGALVTDGHSGPLGEQVRGVFGVLTYRQRYDMLRERFKRDPMTGLYNRGFFDSTLQPEVARAARLDQQLALMMVDIDHFKRINDEHGHPIGDRVINCLAAVLESSVRSADMACRFGGEEFAVVMPDTDAVAAQAVAERVRRAYTEALEVAHPPLDVGKVTVTIGLATFPADADDGLDLLDLADQRLYQGKQAGRDRIVTGGAP